jgi:hypothetical protein
MHTLARTAPDKFIMQSVMLTERHKRILEEIRFSRRLNFSEAVRRGIELLAKEHAPKLAIGAQSEV